MKARREKREAIYAAQKRQLQVGSKQDLPDTASMGVTFDDQGNVIQIDYNSKKIKVAPEANILKAHPQPALLNVETSKIY